MRKNNEIITQNTSSKDVTLIKKKYNEMSKKHEIPEAIIKSMNLFCIGKLIKNHKCLGVDRVTNTNRPATNLGQIFIKNILQRY